MITVVFIFTSVLSIIAFMLSFFQLKEKGFLFNNAYIYASKSERESMNKKPYYQQSAIVFLLIGIVFLILSVDVMLATKWLFYVEMLIIVSLIIYAIASSVYIAKKYK